MGFLLSIFFCKREHWGEGKRLPRHYVYKLCAQYTRQPPASLPCHHERGAYGARDSCRWCSLVAWMTCTWGWPQNCPPVASIGLLERHLQKARDHQVSAVSWASLLHPQLRPSAQPWCGAVRPAAQRPCQAQRLRSSFPPSNMVPMWLLSNTPLMLPAKSFRKVIILQTLCSFSLPAQQPFISCIITALLQSVLYTSRSCCQKRGQVGDIFLLWTPRHLCYL